MSICCVKQSTDAVMEFNLRTRWASWIAIEAKQNITRRVRARQIQLFFATEFFVDIAEINEFFIFCSKICYEGEGKFLNDSKFLSNPTSGNTVICNGLSLRAHVFLLHRGKVCVIWNTELPRCRHFLLYSYLWNVIILLFLLFLIPIHLWFFFAKWHCINVWFFGNCDKMFDNFIPNF